MTYLAVFGPLLLVWALAVWHLSDPKNRADAMPPPPSKWLVDMRMMALTIKLSLVPAFAGLTNVMKTAVRQMEDFQVAHAKMNAALKAKAR